MSKLSFRARALDASKPMPVFMAEELPDLPEYSAINRAVPQMPSGMEKEEECEHHLQRAICAGLIIPTPEVSDANLDAYDKLYPPNYKQPRQLIHMQPFAMEQDIPDYDMDSEDERWLVSQAKKLDLTPLKFEEMMDRLEKSSGQTVVTLNEAKALLKEDDDLIIAVFDYWLNKRLKTQHPLILSVKTEHRAGSAANNPYLAFRRRTEKMQTRKNRKNDETSYEKMLKLRRDLSRAVTLLELVKRREKTKREYLHLTIEIYEKRYQAQDFSGAMLAEVSALKSSRPAFTQIFQNHHYGNQSWVSKAVIKDEVIPRKEKRQYKKRKHKNSTHGRLAVLPDGLVSSDEEEIVPPPHSPEPEETEEEGPFAFRRNKLCSYHMPISNGLGNWPWCPPQENGLADRKYRFTLTSLSQPRRCIGFARRRFGRGGRVILDRTSTDLDELWRQLDFSVIETPNAKPASWSTVNTNSNFVNNFNSDTNLNLNSHSNYSNLLNTQSVVEVKSAQSGHVQAVSNNLWLSNHTASEVISELVDVKKEALDRTEVSDAKDSQNASDQDEIQQLFREIKRDWLHFRPKTPPPSPEEGPCISEALFNPSSTTPITVELQNLSSCPSTLLDDSLFTTSPFTLQDLYSETVSEGGGAAGPPFDDTRQPPPSEGGSPKPAEKTKDPALDRMFGCSRFQVVSARDLGATSALSSRGLSGGCGEGGRDLSAADECATTPKKQSIPMSILSSTLTSPKFNSVNVSFSSALEIQNQNLSQSLSRQKHTVVNHVTNGPIAHADLMSSNRKGNKMQQNAYTNTNANANANATASGGIIMSATTISTLNSERERNNMRLAVHSNAHTLHNTLNSHSANILDITSLSNESSGGDSSNSPKTNSNSQFKDNNVTSSATTGNSKQNKQTIVRKNNSLPMEVT